MFQKSTKTKKKVKATGRGKLRPVVPREKYRQNMVPEEKMEIVQDDSRWSQELFEDEGEEAPPVAEKKSKNKILTLVMMILLPPFIYFVVTKYQLISL